LWVFLNLNNILEQTMTNHHPPYPLLFGIVIFLLLSGCSSNSEETDRPDFAGAPLKVKVMQVATSRVADQVEIMGTLQAAQNAVISSRISGNITAIEVSPGSRVTKDDLLLRIRADEISAQLQQARAQLDQASRNLDRERKLLAQKAATAEAVKSLEDALKVAQANFREANTMMGYTNVMAPFDGIITRKMVDVGDLATPAKPLLHIENENNLQVMADISETLVTHLSLGTRMDIKVPAAQLEISGLVVEISPVADPRTRTVPIKIDIEMEKHLRSGQFARVILPGNEVETVLVPRESISSFGQMERVFIAVENTARLRLVRTGKQYSQGVEILSGLNPGDLLIIQETDRLKDGRPITIL
jgi:membrane fusion protein, multidrug efflux system